MRGTTSYVYDADGAQLLRHDPTKATLFLMMLSFMDSYTLWRHLPFPPSGSDKGLVLAHSDLAGADEYVTTVIRYVERGIFKPAPVDVLALLQELMHRIDRLGDIASGGDRAVARSQHAYAALLDLVYRQFLEVARSRE
jgi:hypothetical protein